MPSLSLTLTLKVDSHKKDARRHGVDPAPTSFAPSLCEENLTVSAGFHFTEAKDSTQVTSRHTVEMGPMCA
uniref:Uncharacterized protein n=1 Tax=Sphaerodactylus townsendi TaxID=933632 RepID=A0ACB8G9G7_9SAUR